MHKFLVGACKSEDFAQSQKNFARLWYRETVTFRIFGTFRYKVLQHGEVQ